jgi:hypothetical protein
MGPIKYIIKSKPLCTIFFFLAIIAITLIITIKYWFIYPVIIGCIIIGYKVIQQRKINKISNSLDTFKKREGFEYETGYKSINNKKFTPKYKAWLIQKENERERILSQQFQSFKYQQIRYQPLNPSQIVRPYQYGNHPFFTEASYHLKPKYQEIEIKKLLQKRICPNCGVDNLKTVNFCKFCESKLD